MPLIAMRDWPINHQYLMNKTKTELAYLVLDYYHALQDKDTEIAKFKQTGFQDSCPHCDGNFKHSQGCVFYPGDPPAA